MRGVLLLALTLVGCSGFFEDNPQFLETETSAAGTTSTETGTETGGAEQPDGTGATAGDSSSGTELPCDPDAYELNDEEGIRTMLPDLEMVPGNIGQAAAVLEGTGAVDWYAYDGREDGSGPRRAKVIIGDADGVRVCVYIKCLDGVETVDCGADEPVVAPSSGYPGCCGLSEANPTHQCDGIPGGDAYVEVRVSDAMDRNECVPYSLEYRFS